MKKFLEVFQRLGKALMLPVAILPIAGLLQGFGQEKMLNIGILFSAGQILFYNLPLLFAIGIAVGIAHDNNGSAGLAGAVSYFVMSASARSFAYVIKTGSFIGQVPRESLSINIAFFGAVISGIIAGFCYNKFNDIKLPEWLGFFGGKRFVPIVTGGMSIFVGALFGVVWPSLAHGIDFVAKWISESYGVGAFVYGFLNRFLLMFGLHHILNSFIWFVCGEYTASDGVVATGEINRFFAGDPSAGGLTAGFYPITMFALPAVALAMYLCAKKENKKKVGGMMLSVAITTFLTGITSPVEYLFIFCAPLLFVIHASLTGLSVAICQILGVKEGFAFSAGLTDFLIYWPQASKPWIMLLVGVVLFFIYLGVFVFVIKRFNIMTPGRGDDDKAEIDKAVLDSTEGIAQQQGEKR